MEYFILTYNDNNEVVTLIKYLHKNSEDVTYTSVYNTDYREYQHLLDSEDNTVAEMALTILKDKYEKQR